MQKMKLTMSVTVAFWMVALGMSGLCAADLNVERTDTPPKIDGLLDDACWKDAAEIDTLHIIGEPGKTTQAHKIQVTFDDAWLYVAYDIQQSEQRRRPPTHLTHDDYIQRDDCVKLSFDPGTDGAVYYHFKLNRANARREQRNTRAKGQRTATQDIKGWNIPWRSAVQDYRENWTAEIAVPLALLAPVGKLAKARINLLATRYVVVTRDVAVNIAMTEQERLTAAPLEKSFDEPERFIPVKGMENLKVKAPFLPYFENVAGGPYQEKDGRYFYDVSFRVKQFGAEAGRVKLEYEDVPEGAQPQVVAQTADIGQKAGTLVLDISVPVKDTFAKRTGQLRMRDAETGELWQSEPLADDDLIALNTLFSAYLDRSYYTDEQSAKAICAIGLPESSLRDMKLIAKTDQGKVIAASGEGGRPDSAKSLSAETQLNISLTSMPIGATEIAIQLIRPDGTTVFTQALELVKRPPKPGLEWKIDRENRIILRNGKPFFLQGVNLARPGDLEDALRDVSEMGFNAILYSVGYSKWRQGSGLNPSNTAYLDLAKKHGLLVMPWMESYGGRAPKGSSHVDPSGGRSLVSLHFGLIRKKKYAHMTFGERTKFWEDAVAEQMPRFLEAAEHIKDHPNFLGYFIFDEPVQKTKYDQITSGHEFYCKLHETDGYHPVMINYCHIPKGEEYVDWCGILAIDPYWVPPGRPNRVSSFTAYAQRRAAAKRNPIWVIPCPELWSFITKRAVAPQENLCQSYLALIHGAKGLWYFSAPFRYQFTVDGFKKVNEQLKTLGPIVLSPAVEQVINEGKGNFADIQAALFRNPEGGFVLLAANRCEYPVDAVFTLANLGDREKVRQLFATDWSATAEKSSFSDRLEPFGVRAYQYKDLDDIKAPVEIGVAMQARTEGFTPEPLIPVTGRPGKRNLVQNPGFELTPTLPGVPDYYPACGNSGEPLFGQPGALSGLDDTNPFEGRYSLRLGVPPGGAFSALSFKLAPQREQPMPFVFSAYVRADRDGAKAQFLRNGASFGDRKPALLTTEWKRYYKTCEIGPGSTKAYMNSFAIWVRPPTGTAEGCTVWIDAIQVEPGAKPTKYEP